jgi:Semialdehyde dehydrogenase, NAD binding domain
LISQIDAEVKSVVARKRANPSQFSNPNMPATAPAKQLERNFTDASELLCRTLGA